MAIITGTDIREYMTQIPAGAVINTLLDDIALRASDIVEQYAKPLVFASYPGTATFKAVWGDETSWLLLPAYQSGSLVEVRVGSETGTVVDTTNYLTNGQVLEMVGGTSWLASYPYYRTRPYDRPRWGYGPYYVKAKWGYGPAPESILQVALEVAINIYQTRESGGLRETESVEGGVIVTQVTGLSARQKEIIDNVKALYNAGVIA